MKDSTLPQRVALARRATEAFARHFGVSPAVLARAPGRVNLIGEHTDYTGGYVLPVAIDRDVAVAGRPVPGRTVRVFSVDFGEEAAFDLAALRLDPAQRDGAHPWSNYVRGVYAALREAGYEPCGAELAVAGDVPQGAGLSSSAALEVASLLFAQASSGFDVPAVESVRLARRAENAFVGVACGIMDQFVSRLARPAHALFLDTETLHFEHVPLPPGASLVVTDTRVQRQLTASSYNRRREECEQAIGMAHQLVSGWTLVRDFPLAALDGARAAMDATLHRRLRHLVEENARVTKAVDTLRQGDLARFGELMDASHESLRGLFEVSCAELDAAVAIARGVPGVYGARMTGAGFGGCTVALVRDDAVEAVTQALHAEYPRRTGRKPRVWVMRAHEGASAGPA